MHDLAGMADSTDGMIVLTFLQITFLWYRFDKRVHSFVSYIFFHTAVRTVVIASPPF